MRVEIRHYTINGTRWIHCGDLATAIGEEPVMLGPATREIDGAAFVCEQCARFIGQHIPRLASVFSLIDRQVMN